QKQQQEPGAVADPEASGTLAFLFHSVILPEDRSHKRNGPPPWSTLSRRPSPYHFRAATKAGQLGGPGGVLFPSAPPRASGKREPGLARGSWRRDVQGNGRPSSSSLASVCGNPARLACCRTVEIRPVARSWSSAFCVRTSLQPFLQVGNFSC